MGLGAGSLHWAGGEEWEELAKGETTSPLNSVPASSASYPLIWALHPSLGEMGLIRDPSSPFPQILFWAPRAVMLATVPGSDVPELWMVITLVCPQPRAGGGDQEGVSGSGKVGCGKEAS